MNYVSLKLAYSALLAQKTRTLLTILGVSIGIAVVIAIMAAGRGLDKMVMSQLEIYSPNTITVEVKVPATKKTSSENAMGMATGITITTLKERDLIDVGKHRNIESAYGLVIGQAVVKYQSENKTTLLWGQGYSFPEVEKFQLDSGRVYSKEEEESLSQVAILGHATKDALFGEDEAVGKTVYIKGKPFKVVGVAAKRGATFGFDMDNLIILPAKTMQKRILGVDYFINIIAKVKDREKIKETVAEIEEIMRDNHDITDPNKDDFAVNTMEEAAQMLGSVVDGLTLLLVALVCISLLVGGVGIMNIMYVSVSERTFEIGLRKAVGATNKDVLWQFLSEAVILTLSGGILGIILGAIFALLIYLVAVSYNFVWVYIVPLSSVILAVGFSGVIGLIFGLYPAQKAANLNPIEALRKE
ncbi:MAG TPA: ABC transporter permease [Candidatus Magasanikbacteria bacterium]|nr:ABC transporter permease [Candidatus Magasanikbacteria bacterium]